MLIARAFYAQKTDSKSGIDHIVLPKSLIAELSKDWVGKVTSEVIQLVKR